MPSGPTYFVDADVFITAKNRYYAFEICPGFWKSIVRKHHDGRVYSIDRVRSELLAGRETEDLVQWTKNSVPRGFFRNVDEAGDVTTKYGEIMLWAQRSPRFVAPRRRNSRPAPTAGLWRLLQSRTASLSRTSSPHQSQNERSSFLMSVCSSESSTRMLSKCSGSLLSSSTTVTTRDVS